MVIIVMAIWSIFSETLGVKQKYTLEGSAPAGMIFGRWEVIRDHITHLANAFTQSDVQLKKQETYWRECAKGAKSNLFS